MKVYKVEDIKYLHSLLSNLDKQGYKWRSGYSLSIEDAYLPEDLEQVYIFVREELKTISWGESNDSFEYEIYSPGDIKIEHYKAMRKLLKLNILPLKLSKEQSKIYKNYLKTL